MTVDRQGGEALFCTCEPPMFDLDCPEHGGDIAALVVEAIDQGRVITDQPPGRCDLCGAVAETRPYGPNGENICHPCGTGTPEARAASRRAFDARFGGRDA